MSEYNKYNNGKIYKLINKNTNEIIYVGSTTMPLNKRMNQHKYDYKRYNHMNHYNYINTIGGFENINILLIENYSCKNFEELRQREQYYQDLHKNKILNTFNAYINIKEYQQKYRIDNYDKLKKYDEIRNKTECRKEYIRNHRKNYYEKNKIKKLEYNKDYYEKNKDEI